MAAAVTNSLATVLDILMFVDDSMLFYLIAAITLATQRDGSSGGVVRLGVITEKGIQRDVILPADMPKFYEV